MSIEEYGEERLPVKRRSTMEERAERPELKLLARINMAVVTPALLMGVTVMAGFIWQGMEADRRDAKDSARALERSLNTTSAQISDLRSTVDAVVKYQIPGTVQLFNNQLQTLSSNTESRVNAHANRLDELGRVNERQDADIRKNSNDIRELQLRGLRGGGN